MAGQVLTPLAVSKRLMISKASTQRSHGVAHRYPRYATQPRRDQRHVSPCAHALLVLDQAGCGTTRKLIDAHNISSLPYPPAARTQSGQERLGLPGGPLAL